MKYYSLRGVLNRDNVPEPSAKKLMELFKGDGKEIEAKFSHEEHDRPLYRKPYESEIESGEYRSGDFVLTTASDGIM